MGRELGLRRVQDELASALRVPRARSSPLADKPEMIGADTLTGPERFRIDTLARLRPPTSLSPTDWGLIDQDELEDVVRAAAEHSGADVRFGTELIAFAVAPDGVRAVVRDLGSGTEHRVHAGYLIAADGNRDGGGVGLGGWASRWSRRSHGLRSLRSRGIRPLQRGGTLLVRQPLEGG